MQRVFFILGAHPALSVAEICAVVEQRKIAWKLVALSDEVFVIECAHQVTIDIDWFGGVVKVGEIIEERNDISSLIRHELGSALSDQKWFSGKGDARIQFGFSVYQGEQGILRKVLQERVREVEDLGMRWKTELTQVGKRARFVISKERVLSSVIVAREHLLERGVELSFMVMRDRVLIGQTSAVQAFEEYGARDFGRPGHDARSGMLPPKVAQMMVNLATRAENTDRADNADRIILDPFCGSGTILQEALLMGHNVIGSDKSPSAIKDSRQNIKWLTDNFSVSQFPNFQLFQSDVRRVSEKLTTKVDAIVTEPYLGPALRKTPTVQELATITEELTRLYVDAFRIFEQCLKKNGRVCIVFPTFVNVENQPVRYLSHDVIPQLSGWHVVPPFPAELVKHETLRTTPHGMLLYGRPGQKVWREIGVFERKN